METPGFSKSKRYIDKRIKKFGKCVWLSLFCCICCTNRKQTDNLYSKPLPVPDPDSIGTDYSYLDSLDLEIKKRLWNYMAIVICWICFGKRDYLIV